ncbi:MAG: GntR family transcriptional regulator [Victivallales bacterium]|nr:GntR family transcriptional regulator [Victivallales bacterium]
MLELLTDRIESGYYGEGKRLPSERKLAQEYEVPQSRVHRVLQELVVAGRLECRRNDGYYPKLLRKRQFRGRRVAICIDSDWKHEPKDFYVSSMFQLAPAFGIDISVVILPRTKAERDVFLLHQVSDGVEGLILYPHFVEDSDVLPLFRAQGIPVFFWDFSPLPGICPGIGIDHFASGLLAAKVLARRNLPVCYIGLEGATQNRLKAQGFHAGCQRYGVTIQQETFLDYKTFIDGKTVYLPDDLPEHGLFYTATRHTTSLLIGRMLDRGLFPGRDYFLLATDRLHFADGSAIQLDAILRDASQMSRSLLEAMRNALDTGELPCNDLRAPMQYVPGNTLFPK